MTSRSSSERRAKQTNKQAVVQPGIGIAAASVFACVCVCATYQFADDVVTQIELIYIYTHARARPPTRSRPAAAASEEIETTKWNAATNKQAKAANDLAAAAAAATTLFSKRFLGNAEKLLPLSSGFVVSVPELASSSRTRASARRTKGERIVADERLRSRAQFVCS